jgi:hypothetical protein
MLGGRSYCPLDEILPPPAVDMINDTGEESDVDGEMLSPNPASFGMTETSFRMFERKLHTQIIRQQ